MSRLGVNQGTQSDSFAKRQYIVSMFINLHDQNHNLSKAGNRDAVVLPPFVGASDQN